MFVPSKRANYVTTSITTPVDLIAEAVLIKVTAQQDPNTPSLDVTATAVGTLTNLATLIPGGGVDFRRRVTYSSTFEGFPAPFGFNSNGEASAQLADGNNIP